MAANAMPLYLPAFDRRSPFERGLLHPTPPLTAQVRQGVTRAKGTIFAVPGFVGFAVGRRWHDTLAQHPAARVSESDTVGAVAERYRELTGTHDSAGTRIEPA